jgi:hypothetical protein
MTDLQNAESQSGTAGVSIESLLAEIDDGEETSTAAPLGPASDRSRPQEVLSYVHSALFTDLDFRFSEDTVKQNLDETLLMLIALREGGTHGKGLMDDLAMYFDSRLSPGTIYPRLHELEDEGLLAMQEMVRTKEYRVADDEAARRRLQHAMAQHLTLGYALYLTLEDL